MLYHLYYTYTMYRTAALYNVFLYISVLKMCTYSYVDDLVGYTLLDTTTADDLGATTCMCSMSTSRTSTDRWLTSNCVFTIHSPNNYQDSRGFEIYGRSITESHTDYFERCQSTDTVIKYTTANVGLGSVCLSVCLSIYVTGYWPCFIQIWDILVQIFEEKKHGCR